MEDVLAAREYARQKAAVADHILTQTYPLVKDAKLLLAVLQNVSDSFDASLLAALSHEHSLKRAPPPPETFEARVATFSQHVAPRYEVPSILLRALAEVRESLKEHKESAVEFSRKEQFVICNESYRLRTLNESQLRSYVAQAKELIKLIEGRVTRNDAVIARRR